MIEKNQSKSNAGRRGGARKGAGRKPGSATKKTREIADKAMAEGVSPLEFMLSLMRAEPPEGLEPRDMLAAQSMRFEAAKAAAPYIHPRLAAVEHTGADGTPLQAPVIQFVRDADPAQ
jgi:hypothetical protein